MDAAYRAEARSVRMRARARDGRHEPNWSPIVLQLQSRVANRAGQSCVEMSVHCPPDSQVRAHASPSTLARMPPSLPAFSLSSSDVAGGSLDRTKVPTGARERLEPHLGWFEDAVRGATLKLTQGLRLSRIVFVGRGALALAFLIGPVIADSVSPDGPIHTEIIPDLLDLYSVLLFLGVVVVAVSTMILFFLRKQAMEERQKLQSAASSRLAGTGYVVAVSTNGTNLRAARRCDKANVEYSFQGDPSAAGSAVTAVTVARPDAEIASPGKTPTPEERKPFTLGEASQPSALPPPQTSAPGPASVPLNWNPEPDQVPYSGSAASSSSRAGAGATAPAAAPAAGFSPTEFAL